MKTRDSFYVILLFLISSILACKKDETTTPNSSDYYFSGIINNTLLSLNDGDNAKHDIRCCGHRTALQIYYRSEEALLTSIDNTILIAVSADLQDVTSLEEKDLKQAGEELFSKMSLNYAVLDSTKILQRIGDYTVEHIATGIRIDYQDKLGKIWSSAKGIQPSDSYCRILSHKYLGKITNANLNTYSFEVELEFNAKLFDNQNNSTDLKQGKSKVGIWLAP